MVVEVVALRREHQILVFRAALAAAAEVADPCQWSPFQTSVEVEVADPLDERLQTPLWSTRTPSQATNTQQRRGDMMRARKNCTSFLLILSAALSPCFLLKIQHSGPTSGYSRT